MSVRDMSYPDYDIDETRLKDIFISIKNNPESQKVFLECCMEAKPEIANDLYYSIVGGVSYDDMKMIKCVPIPKVDYYGYRRKAIALFFRKTRKEEKNQLLSGQMRFEDLKI